jgi:hypothetical protein
MGDLEAMRRKDPEYLNSLLWTRINQQKMLNNTLCEVMAKNSNSKAIDMLKEELNEVMEEIDEINLDIASLNKNKDEEVTYSFYDSVKKEGCPNAMEEKACEENKKSKGFYDSIVRHNKAAQFKEAEDVEEGQDIKETENGSIKELIEDFRDTADSRLQANRFLVDLKGALNIPEIMVSSVSFDPNENGVWVCIYDFVLDFNGKKFPILQLLRNAPKSFHFTIKHLECNGKVVYTEKYYGCHLTKIYRDPIDYAIDDFSKIQIFINYQNVEYGTE